MERKIVLAGNSTQDQSNLVVSLERHRYSVITISDKDRLIGAVKEFKAQAVILNRFDFEWDGIRIAETLRHMYHDMPIILAVDQSTEELAIRALRVGVSDYYKMPVQMDYLISRLDSVFSKDINISEHRTTSQEPSRISYNSFVGPSDKMRRIKLTIRKCSVTNSNVLITGETGTGKELVARFIHSLGQRNSRPLVCINCAAIPDTLLESELFGYEKGAFTGAQNCREGKLMHANTGTLFLDEIGDMSLMAQAKILRAIETKVVQRLGSRHTASIDVRIIAATNQNLEPLIAEKLFRKDLFFRLNVVRIHIPPLRERKQDINALCEYFIKLYNNLFDNVVTGVSEEVLAAFMRYDWPGNVRELKNAIEAAYVNQPIKYIRIEDLNESFAKQLTFMSSNYINEDEEKDKLLVALVSTRWNKSKAAEILNWSRMTLYRKIEKYHITDGRNEKELLPSDG